MDVVKPDPAVTQETPEPIVYRCRKCRRVVATKSNLLTHKPKLPGQSPAKYESFSDLACGGVDSADERDEFESFDKKEQPTDASFDSDATVGPTREAEPSTSATASGKDPMPHVISQMRRNSIGSDHSNRSSEKSGVCDKIYFTEPLAWMTDIFHNTQGRLYCPKCTVKLGSFNWLMGKLTLYCFVL